MWYFFNSSGLKGLVVSSETFSFVINGVVVSTNKAVASFVSPLISRILIEDKLFNRFEIKIERFFSYSFVRQFEELLNGKGINIDEVNCEFFGFIGEMIENGDLVAACDKCKNLETKLDNKNVFDNLIRKYEINVDFSSEIAYIASNIMQISREKLKLLCFDHLNMIFSSQSLKIENEDWLFLLIFEIVDEKGDKYTNLLRNVRFEFISPYSMRVFLSRFSQIDIDQEIWKALAERLLCPVTPTKKLDDRYIKDPDSVKDNDDEIIMNFPFSGNPFSGIFAQMAETSLGNPHTKGVIEITSSSRERGNAWQIIDMNWNGWFFTKNVPNSWIMFDMKQLMVSISWYSLMSDGNGVSHLKSWTIEGSNDTQTWNTIDEKNNIQETNTNFHKCSFICNKSPFYRYIRLRSHAPNHSGNHYLGIARMELFGRIKSI